MSGFHTLMMAGTPVYSVTFDYGGIPEQRVLKNKQTTRPADPYKENYHFTGWFVNGVMFDFNIPVTGNLQLIAGWSLITHTVTFDVAGGEPLEVQTIAHGNLAENIIPTRTYYTFTGWTLEGVAFDFNTPVTTDITLTAGWERALITQSGTTSVIVLNIKNQNRPYYQDVTYGVIVTFPVPFVQITTSQLQGNNLPYRTYDNVKDNLAPYTSYLNNSGFGQATGDSTMHEKSNGTEYDYWRTEGGIRSGTLSWTATGYCV